MCRRSDGLALNGRGQTSCEVVALPEVGPAADPDEVASRDWPARLVTSQGRDGNEKVTEADFLTVFNGDGVLAGSCGCPSSRIRGCRQQTSNASEIQTAKGARIPEARLTKAVRTVVRVLRF